MFQECMNKDVVLVLAPMEKLWRSCSVGLSVGDELAGCGQKGRECLCIHANQATAHLDNISLPWCRYPSPALKKAGACLVQASCRLCTAGMQELCRLQKIMSRYLSFGVSRTVGITFFCGKSRFCHSCKICRIEVACKKPLLKLMAVLQNICSESIGVSSHRRLYWNFFFT